MRNSLFFIRYSSTKGFTLIETLIYLTIFTIVGVFLVDILIGSLSINIESQSARIVSEEGRFVTETVKRLAREASLIDMSTTTPQGTLILRMNDYTGNRDFVHVYKSGTKIYVAEGVINDNGASSTCPQASDPVCTLNALTDDRVSVDSLAFKRISNAPGQDTLQVNFTLSYVTDSSKGEFSKSFETAISRVSAAVFDSSLLPNPGSSLNIGVSGQKWADGFFSSNLTIDGSLIVDTNTFYVNSVSDKVGIGTTNPGSKLEVFSGNIDVKNGDIYFSTGGKGLILKSSGGTCWKLTVTDTGGISTSSIPCL